MSTAVRPTVLVDVQPAVLHGALVVLLDELGVDEVIDLTAPPASVDALVMSAGRTPPPVAARLVITLPPGEELTGPSTVAWDGEPETAAVRIARIEDILTLLDVCCPGASPRTPR